MITDCKFRIGSEYITIHRSEYERLLDQDRFLDCIYSTDIVNTVEFQIALNRYLTLDERTYVAYT